MKNLFASIFLLINLTIGFSQFDLFNTRPVSNNPAYVGSTGKNRISTTLTAGTVSPIVEASYDFFSKKLMGGWGAYTLYNRGWGGFSNSFNHQLAYSPKITDAKERFTYAPAIKFIYKHVHVDETEVVISDTAPGEPLKFTRNEIGVSLAFNINDKNNVFGSSIEYINNANRLKSQIQYVHRFNKNETSNKSSTFSASLVYRRKDAENRSIFFDPKQSVFYADLLYAVKIKKLLFQIGNDRLIHKKIVSPTTPESFYVSDPFILFEFINKIGFGYKGEKLTTMLDVNFSSLDRESAFRLSTAFKF